MSKNLTPMPRAAAAKVAPQALLANLLEISVSVITQIDKGMTERAQIRADRDEALAKIDATAKILTHALELAFDERARVFEAYFGSLAIALKSGDTASAAAILNGIVETSNKSPLTDLGSLAHVTSQLQSRDTVFEL